MYDLYPHSHSFIHGKDQLVSLLYCEWYLSILSQSVLCNWIFKYLSETEPSGHIGQSNNPPGVCIVLFLSIKWVLNNFSIQKTRILFASPRTTVVSGDLVSQAGGRRIQTDNYCAFTTTKDVTLPLGQEYCVTICSTHYYQSCKQSVGEVFKTAAIRAALRIYANQPTFASVSRILHYNVSHLARE